ncbi:MAG: LysR family transcriptional regulator [Provencibacterium sp.]|jgi:DNA-binding transcriptional LysR family regulator|nr:LysR family transcriptional regulator [Provencibacterium sp.]
MEFRVLQYFLAAAREQSLSGAAEYLHLSQPTLSRQLKDLEEELGKQLFLRSSKGITLTEEGMILRKRAEEIVLLMKKTEDEIALSDESVAGDVYIGAGESDVNRLIGRAACELQRTHPDIHYHISSGNSVFVLEQLDRGLIDFGLVYGGLDHTKYESFPLPVSDTFGVLMRRDSELAKKEVITPQDLFDKPLIVSRQEELEGWRTMRQISADISKLNIVATYTLIFNGSLLVDEGLGYAICFDKLIHTEGTGLCFRPLCPAWEVTASVIWKKYQLLSKPAQKFLETLREMF